MVVVTGRRCRGGEDADCWRGYIGGIATCCCGNSVRLWVTLTLGTAAVLLWLTSACMHLHASACMQIRIHACMNIWQEYAGTMHGAMLSGMHAAQRILYDRVNVPDHLKAREARMCLCTHMRTSVCAHAHLHTACVRLWAGQFDKDGKLSEQRTKIHDAVCTMLPNTSSCAHNKLCRTDTAHQPWCWS